MPALDKIPQTLASFARGKLWHDVGRPNTHPNFVNLWSLKTEFTKFRILRVRLIVPFMSRRKIKNDLWKYRLLHVKCRLILISNLNLIGLFSTELQRCGKRDIENEIDDWDLRLNKCWQAVHIDCYRWPVGSFLGICRLAITVNLASNVGKETTLISFDPHCLYTYHCMPAFAQWRVCMHMYLCAYVRRVSMQYVIRLCRTYNRT